ncbi:MAG: transporter substrate-binding domain-containing protein [Rhodospirillales bacterium]|nr:transporter substrate-binding domain-containing protein [Rhodospirillales bacterium]
MTTPKCIFGLLLAISAFVGAAPAQADHLRLVTGESFPPFADRGFHQGGIVTEIVRKSFERAGYDHTDVIWRSWLKGFEMTVEGEVDGTFPYAFTRKRAKSVLFSDPITNLTAYGWYFKERGIYDDNLDLVGKTLCLPLGYAELGNTRHMLSAKQATRMSPPDMETCFKLLVAGRVDSVVCPFSEAIHAIEAAGFSVDDFGHIAEGLSDMPLHFIVGKMHPNAEKIIADFNGGLKELTDSGELSRILGSAQY